MTFPKFTKIFDKSAVKIDIKDHKLKYAIDAYVEIFRLSGVQHISGLVNSVGEPTQHIKAALCNITKALRNNISNVWVFDGRHRKEKSDTIDARKKTRKENQQKIKDLEQDIEEIQSLTEKLSLEEIKEIDGNHEKNFDNKKQLLKTLKARNPNQSLFSKFVDDVKFLLTCLGVDWCTSPDGVDAEQMGAWLAIEGIVDGVRTTDPDALMFGSPILLKKIPKKTGMYNLYKLNDILSTYNLTHDQFIKCGVAMGTDFAPKTPRVGEKTVIKKVLADRITWTDEQNKAIAIFKDIRPSNITINKSKRTKESIQQLSNWLVDVQGFNVAGVKKSLSGL